MLHTLIGVCPQFEGRDAPALKISGLLGASEYFSIFSKQLCQEKFRFYGETLIPEIQFTSILKLKSKKQQLNKNAVN